MAHGTGHTRTRARGRRVACAHTQASAVSSPSSSAFPIAQMSTAKLSPVPSGSQTVTKLMDFKCTRAGDGRGRLQLHQKVSVAQAWPSLQSTMCDCPRDSQGTLSGSHCPLSRLRFPKSRLQPVIDRRWRGAGPRGATGGIALCCPLEVPAATAPQVPTEVVPCPRAHLLGSSSSHSSACPPSNEFLFADLPTKTMEMGGFSQLFRNL